MKKLCIILSISVAYTAFTPYASAMDLQEVLVHTYQTNPTIAAERANLRATDEIYNQALAGFLPNANLTGELNKNSVKSENLPTNKLNGNIRDLSVSQPVFNGGGTIAQMNRARNQITAAQATLVRTEQTVFLNAITAYMDVIGNEEILKLSEKNLEVLRKNLEATNLRFQLQEVTRTDVAQSNSRVSRAISDQKRALGDVEIARSRFKNVTGIDPVMLTMPNSAKNIPSTVDDVVKIAVKNNPDVTIAEYTWAAAKNAVSVSKATLLPTVSVRGQVRDTTG